MDQEAVDGIEASAITRGRVLTTVAFLLAIGAAVTLLTLVLLGLEYDFDDGILDPFDPAWAPLLVLGAAISAPIVLLSMKPWTRWPVGVGFALGSAWLLLKADFGDEHLPRAARRRRGSTAVARGGGPVGACRCAHSS
jgi:hypothetical protein